MCPSPNDLSASDAEGICIRGGQSGPTSAVNESGEVLWTQPGSSVYGDVLAAGDGAVYVVDRGPRGARLVAYEFESGETRWERAPIDPYGAEVGWPWHVSGEVLFTIWSNLALLSTEDGTTLWRTSYPVVSPGIGASLEFPRMTGVRTNDDTVFVAFSSIPSGGD